MTQYDSSRDRVPHEERVGRCRLAANREQVVVVAEIVGVAGRAAGAARGEVREGERRAGAVVEGREIAPNVFAQVHPPAAGAYLDAVGLTRNETRRVLEAEGPDGNGLLARLPDPRGVHEVVAVRTSQRGRSSSRRRCRRRSGRGRRRPGRPRPRAPGPRSRSGGPSGSPPFHHRHPFPGRPCPACAGS